MEVRIFGRIIKASIVSFAVAVVALIFSGCEKEEGETIVVEKPQVVDKTYFPENTQPLLDDVQHKTFNYFWDTDVSAGSHATSGLAAEGSQRHNSVTIGGAGFGVMSIMAGVERGWITREQGALRLQKAVRWLGGKAVRIGGVWPHWLNPETGQDNMFNKTRGGVKKPSGDLIESSFMMSGLLMARAYFNSGDAVEKEIRDSVTSFYEAIDWNLYTNGKNELNWIYFPENENGEEEYHLPIKGWNEGWISYILALGAPNSNISESVYNGWIGSIKSLQNPYGYNLKLRPAKGGPMFLSHYSMVGLDPRKLEDNNTNYWQHVVNHAMINRHYCVEEAPEAHQYNSGVWGLTACYGGDKGYSARNPNNDDGTIAPTAALGSFPYVPFYAMEFLVNTRKNHSRAYGTYGFIDAFRPLDNWYETRHLAIDQGPIVVMIENYRTGLFWDLLMSVPEIQLGLQRAGLREPDYKTGFHLAVPEVKSGAYDIMMHPDKGHYLVDFFLETAGKVSFELVAEEDGELVILEENINYSTGAHVLEFDRGDILPGSIWKLIMKQSEKADIELKVKFH